MKKLLEVCVDSLASARAAQAGGADRLEFCSALAVGGLSPYPELLRQIKAECSLPVRCLMRPRAGDFLYTKDEIDLLCAQIHTLRDTGADGFVIGALTPDGTLDKPAMAQLLDACGDKPITLHRCIDVSCDLVETYRDAATLGIDTILTSGGAASCRQGTAALAKMLALRNELQGPEVLIGAGVSAAVITAVFFYTAPPLGPVLAVITLLIALVRVIGGVHFVKDVTAGALLGGALGWLGCFVL